MVLNPFECPDDVLLRLHVPGLVGAHAFRLVADQIRHLASVGAVAPPPSRCCRSWKILSSFKSNRPRLVKRRAGDFPIETRRLALAGVADERRPMHVESAVGRARTSAITSG
jgi:hypothetical protein